MSWNVTTGLDADGVVARVHRELVEDPDSLVVPRRMWALGLYWCWCCSCCGRCWSRRSAAELFGISQATVSRQWTAMLPVVEGPGHPRPNPARASVSRVVLVDGTLVTTWDRSSEGTAVFSGEHRDTGFNVQVAAALAGNLLAVSAPVPGSRCDCEDVRVPLRAVV